jgi:pantoate--beta-alanine ligase
MLEIEQKYRTEEHARIRQALHTLGARGPEARREVDGYFNAPDRDFARTGEAFRLRSVGEKNLYTYKGPRQAGVVKVRQELEVELPPGPAAAEEHRKLLVLLGYRPVAAVAKDRESYGLEWLGQNLTVCLDTVQGLGSFVEVEAIAEESGKEAAVGAVEALARHLGLTTREPRSYLTMLLESKNLGTAVRPTVARTPEELASVLADARRKGQTVGFIPTMGALHAGHRSLIERSRAQDQVVVASIFVNPAQFGPNEDLSRYPRPLEKDLQLCAGAGVDLVFLPSPEVIYPEGFRTWVEVTGLQDVLEGASRPGHFRGVATVVLKLFQLVQPTRAYFGQKDAQQARIIQQMTRDLNVPVDLIVCPTQREPDGLALSSRNVYLDPAQRAAAVSLSKALAEAEAAFRGGERGAQALRRILERAGDAPGARLDYAALVDADSLLPIEGRVERPALAALAVWFGGTRLIDNAILTP